MLKIQGQDVFETIAEIVNPDRSAVLVIDMQNDACSEDGEIYRGGVDNTMIRALVDPIAHFLYDARRYSVPIVFVRSVRSINGRSLDSPAFIRTSSRVFVTGGFAEGSWGAELIPEVKRRSDEPIVTKYASGCFADTALDKILRCMRIETVIIVGQQTAGCVLGAAMGASDKGYYCVVISDLVAAYSDEQNNAAMSIMAQRYDITSNEQIVQEWAKLAEIS